MQDLLIKYLKAFKNLRIDRAHGSAPHKPILLLSILQSFQLGILANNKITITPELVALFKSNWNLLVTSQHDCRFALPFYHLTSDGFWQLVPKPGFETILRFKSSMRSFANLIAAIEYAYIDEGLWGLFVDMKTNNILQHFILDEYFPEAKDRYNILAKPVLKIFNEIEKKILQEDSFAYQKEIEDLILVQNEEEIFLRGSIFKREIPKIYNNTCCISGMKINATITVSMIDACHIVPFSESHDDTISNGIALCPNLHRAFDRGLITIRSDYTVAVSKTFIEDQSAYSICNFEGKKIRLPVIRQYWPQSKNLEWHKENIFKSALE